jgi:hypothetical protein
MLSPSLQEAAFIGEHDALMKIWSWQRNGQTEAITLVYTREIV